MKTTPTKAHKSHLGKSAAAVKKSNQGGAAVGRQERSGHPPGIQHQIDGSLPVVTQRRQIERVFGARQQPNNTGLPDNLKTGIESLSGVDLSDVRVQRNSTKPAQLNALAYTQGNEIYLGPGQERHLPHEAWHAVQQKQGRVQPTIQVNGASINDDHMLEKEADEMGTRSNWMRAVEGRRSRSQFLTSQKGPYGTALSHDAKPIQAIFGRNRVQSPRALINAHLQSFKSKTSAGTFKKRPEEWRRATEYLVNVRNQNPQDDAEYYNLLTDRLMRAEMLMNSARFDPGNVNRIDENNRRLERYTRWKAELLNLLDADELRNHMRALAADPGDQQLRDGDSYTDINPDRELTPIGKLVSNTFGQINRALRDPGTDQAAAKAAYLDSALIMEHYKKKSNRNTRRNLEYANSGGVYIRRYAGTLFDGSTPSPDAPPAVGTLMTDDGWTFFGEAGSGNISAANRRYTIEASLTKAVRYTNELYGRHERGREFATPPGSTFRFEGYVAGYRGIWRFRQVN